MLTRVSCVVGPTVIAAAMVLIAGGTAAAQGSVSGSLAALFFPGRLLVVSARYEVPLYADEKIAAGNYRDLYIDLNTAFIAGTKILITDGGADGLRDDDPADSADTGGRLVRFDGDWIGQQLSQAEYTTLFNEADAGYARMLRALLTEVN